jgi:hypothetical protein
METLQLGTDHSRYLSVPNLIFKKERVMEGTMRGTIIEAIGPTPTGTVRRLFALGEVLSYRNFMKASVKQLWPEAQGEPEQNPGVTDARTTKGD